MGFTKKTWKNRIAEYINRRLLTKEDGSTELVTVARDEGTISQEGDAFNAANMNDLEDRIEAEFNNINQSLAVNEMDLSKLGSGFKVLQSSQYPLSIGDNTLRFGVAEWNDNCFSNDTFTAKNNGRYNFHALMQFVISEETRVAVFFKVNGVSVAYTTDELIGFNKIVSSDMYCNLNVGDTVQLCVYTSKSASLQNGFSFVGELIKPL